MNKKSWSENEKAKVKSIYMPAQYWWAIKEKAIRMERSPNWLASKILKKWVEKNIKTSHTCAEECAK
jgi:hypothetical protein